MKKKKKKKTLKGSARAITKRENVMSMIIKTLGKLWCTITEATEDE